MYKIHIYIWLKWKILIFLFKKKNMKVTAPHCCNIYHPFNMTSCHIAYTLHTPQLHTTLIYTPTHPLIYLQPTSPYLSLQSPSLSLSLYVRCMGVQKWGGEAGGEPGCGLAGRRPARVEPGPEGAGTLAKQWSDNFICSSWEEAIGTWVGEVLWWPWPSPVPQEVHCSSHLSPQGFQQVQVHAHVWYRRKESQCVRGQGRVVSN